MTTAVERRLPNRYKIVSEEKAGGATYTPKKLADFVAEQILRSANVTGSSTTIKVLDPAVGDGELLLSLLERLAAFGIERVQVHGFETDAKALALARSRIGQRFPLASLHLEHGDFLSFVLEKAGLPDRGTLFENQTMPRYDLIIANPPYVRTQIMGSEQAQLMATQFGLSGRVDLYHAFVVGIAHVLRPGGVAGIIVSNRFMTTRSGGAVRQAIREHFSIRHVWDLGDTKLFGAAVLPAILVLETRQDRQDKPPPFTAIYETTREATAQPVAGVIEALGYDGVVAIKDGRRFLVSNGQLDLATRPEQVWRITTPARDEWLASVTRNTWRRFGDVGKVRVGVKTCADRVFIRRDWDSLPEQVRPELLRPLTTHHVAQRFRAATPKGTWRILYPHESVNGQRRPVDLSLYPKTCAYLQQHRSSLEGRGYVIESGRHWYEIWVPQDPALWAAPKLVFRDITDAPTFWIDLEGTIVNGDCYWLTVNRKHDTDVLWLAAAVANSTFVETFYDRCFNNKLYAGRRRFITQYVEQFPLPDPALPRSRTIVALAKEIYQTIACSSEASEVAARLDRLVWEAFGVSAEEVGR